MVCAPAVRHKATPASPSAASLPDMTRLPTRPSLALPALFADDGVDDVRAELIPRAWICRGHDVVVDGGDVRVVSTAGLGVLVAAALLAQMQGGSLVVQRVSTQLADAVGRVRGHPIRLQP